MKKYINPNILNEGNDLEVWKDIIGYEGLYQVSNYGRIKSKTKFRKCGKQIGYWQAEQIIKSSKNNSGYLIIHLSKNNIKKSFLIHRLVASHFKEVPNIKYEVEL